ncbi:MAG: helix-turn-helix domain-containing protein [Muribaculaceae bacterium]|nr:helix-turn-helix domain-containing protein [Muribaculaceae bacterium]
MLFSERIRTLRNKQGILQRTLAKAIGVDIPMYSRYEHGERRPKREQVVKLARLLNTDANELVALWLAEEAVNTIGHDKMSARASQLLLEALDKKSVTTQGQTSNIAPPEASEHQLAEKERLLAEKDELLAEKDELVAEKERQLTKMEGLLAEKERQLTKMEGLLTEKERQLAARERQLEAHISEARAAQEPPAAEEDCTLWQAPAVDAAQRTLVRLLGDSRLPHYEQGDARLVMQRIEDDSVDCIVTTPPYWSLRRHGTDRIEAETLQAFINELLRVMAECRRVLKPEGSLWLAMGDAYDNHTLQAVPWRLAIAMTDKQGWTLRNDVVLNTRQNASDNAHTHLRNTHECVFHFTKQPTGFHYDADELRRVFNDVAHLGDKSNKGLMPADVWEIALPKSPIERYITAPEELCRLAIVATCPAGGLVLDPYCGTGTTCKVAYDLNRRSIGIDINADRLRLANARVEQKSLSLF